jgi:hypothetical protein
VGTSTRLVHYQNGNIRSIDWEQFSGEIELNGNDHKGNISLQMRTGKMVSRKTSQTDMSPMLFTFQKFPMYLRLNKFVEKELKKMILLHLQLDTTSHNLKQNLVEYHQ